MGVWQNIRGGFRQMFRGQTIVEARSWDDWLELWARETAAGLLITPQSAMEVPAVAAAVRVIGETCAQLPVAVFRKDDNGSREIANDLPAARLLGTHGDPNEWQTSFDFREFCSRQAALRGNGYALKNVVRGRVRELIPLPRHRVRARLDENLRPVYSVTLSDGRSEDFGPERIFHLRGPSDDGFLGNDMVTQHRETIGLALAQERYAAMLFANGTRLSGVLETPHKLGDTAYERLKKSFEEKFTGVENAHKTILLEEDTKFKPVSMTSEDAQLLESRKLQRSIIAAIWRIPPHMIGDLDKATFSNIENLARQFVDYALMPWLDRWQQAIEKQLMTPAERRNHVVKFNVNGLLRGDAKSRAQFYNTGINGGWLSPNEVREKEDMPPREGGDEFIRPLNVETSANDNEDEEADDDVGEDADRTDER